LKFVDASAVERVDESKWKGEVQPDWDIFGVANGGYLMSIAARAMSEAAGGRLPVSVNAHFIRPAAAGPVEIAVAMIKEGRGFSTMRATLSAGSESVTLLGSFADPETLGGDVAYMNGKPPQMPAPEECRRAVPADDAPLPPPIVGQFEECLHPDDARVLEGRPSGVARVRGWFRLHDGEALDRFTPLLVADAFPPAVFNAGLPLAWTPTLEMTTHVRSTPSTDWLKCIFTTRFVTGGFLEEDGEIWDESGRLVALSRQLALVPH
jgi:acyl-CoA thioesterase